MSNIKKPIYSDSIEKYRQRLYVKDDNPNSIINLAKTFTPSNNPLIIPDMTPFGIAILIGFPLFKNQWAKDYEEIIKRLKAISPNQYYYENFELHISLCVLIRADDINKWHYYIPSGDHKDYYKRYLEIMRSIKFKPFSLKPLGLFSNGIIIWDTADNENEIFNIRSQIVESLLQEREKDSSFYFDEKGGLPIIPDVIHTTFVRYYNPPELYQNFEKYKAELQKINQLIKDHKIFKGQLEIDEIAFLDEHFDNSKKPTNGNIRNGYYQTQILDRVSLH